MNPKEPSIITSSSEPFNNHHALPKEIEQRRNIPLSKILKFKIEPPSTTMTSKCLDSILKCLFPPMFRIKRIKFERVPPCHQRDLPILPTVKWQGRFGRDFGVSFPNEKSFSPLRFS